MSTMNARLPETRGEEGGDKKEVGAEVGGGRGGDRRQQQGRCTDSHNWIGKASGYADFEEQRHVTPRRQVSSREQTNLPKSSSSSLLYGLPAARGSGDISPVNASAPSPSITSQLVRDNSETTRSRDIETSRWMKLPYNTFPASCSSNMARSVAPAACNNVAPVMEQTLFRGQPLLETSSSTPPTWKNCPQLSMGPVDVEDLAMYFDSSATDKPPSTGGGGRAISSRRSRYGTTRVDSRQDCRDRLDVDNNLLSPYYTRPRYPEPGGLDFAAFPRPCQVGDLPIRGMGHPGGPSVASPARLCVLPHPDFYNQRTTCDLRLGEPRTCQLGSRELMGRGNLGHDDPGDWFCGNNCPELFNFCSEQRWLQCPASDRCPLYDTSYDPGAPLLPPCTYENLHMDHNDNDYWHYGCAEDEQLLEDYL